MPTTFTGPMIMNTAVSLQVWAPARRLSVPTPIAACAALSLASAPTTRSPTPVGPLRGTPFFGGPHRLAFYDGRTRGGFSSSLPAGSLPQPRVDPLPSTVDTPHPE